MKTNINPLQHYKTFGTSSKEHFKTGKVEYSNSYFLENERKAIKAYAEHYIKEDELKLPKHKGFVSRLEDFANKLKHIVPKHK